MEETNDHKVYLRNKEDVKNWITGNHNFKYNINSNPIEYTYVFDFDGDKMDLTIDNGEINIIEINNYTFYSHCSIEGNNKLIKAIIFNTNNQQDFIRIDYLKEMKNIKFDFFCFSNIPLTPILTPQKTYNCPIYFPVIFRINPNNITDKNCYITNVSFLSNATNDYIRPILLKLKDNYSIETINLFSIMPQFVFDYVTMDYVTFSASAIIGASTDTTKDLLFNYIIKNRAGFNFIDSFYEPSDNTSSINITRLMLKNLNVHYYDINDINNPFYPSQNLSELNNYFSVFDTCKPICIKHFYFINEDNTIKICLGTPRSRTDPIHTTFQYGYFMENISYKKNQEQEYYIDGIRYFNEQINIFQPPSSEEEPFKFTNDAFLEENNWNITEMGIIWKYNNPNEEDYRPVFIEYIQPTPASKKHRLYIRKNNAFIEKDIYIINSQNLIKKNIYLQSDLS